MKKYRFPLLTCAATVVTAAALLGVFWRPVPSSAVSTPERQVRFYQCSMHPLVKSDRPGRCSICGMDLSSIYEDQKATGVGENCLSVSSNAVTVLNVQTEVVKRQPLARTLRVAGTIEANETSKTIISAPAAGRVENLAVDYAGVEVHEGQRLLTFYSPELTQERRRYVFRAKLADQRDPTGGLAKPMSQADPYYSDLVAPHDGTVIERKVTRGQYVAEGEKLFTIADASVLWFRFDIYEQQLPWVRCGQKIQVTTPAVPGRVFTAVISFIEPMLNDATRTIKVRADIPNPVVEVEGRKERLLRFGLYAEGAVQAETPNLLAVPRAAILNPGHSTYAFVDKGAGTYERRQVKLGREGNGSWEILGGLIEGERVVISGNVLLDGQAEFNRGGSDPMADTMDMAAGAGSPMVNHRVSNPMADTMDMTAGAGSPMVNHRASDPMADTVDMAPSPTSTEPAAPPATRARRNTPRTDNPELKAQSLANARLHAPAATPAQLMSRARAQAPGDTAATNAPAMPLPSRTSSAARAYARQGATILDDTPRGRRNAGRVSSEDLMFERLREVRSGDALEDASAKTNGPANLSPSQCQSLRAFLTTSDGIAHALATDDLAAFNGRLATLSNQVAALEKEFVLGDSWKGHILHFRSAACWQPAKDLSEARARFLPFTINVVTLATELKKQEPAFAQLKVFHCPMAPQPGLWVQLDGPLLNPFFGLKMQHCGKEWDEESQALALDAKAAAGPHGQLTGPGL